MSKRKFTGKGPLVSCKDCGRDTQGKFGYCFRCSGGGGNSHAKPKNNGVRQLRLVDGVVVHPDEDLSSTIDDAELQYHGSEGVEFE